MMNPKVVLLAIDAPNQALFDEWLATGLLPHIAAIAGQGVAVRHTHQKRFRNERCWSVFLSGCDSASTGAEFRAEDYSYAHLSPQRHPLPLFYDCGPGVRVCQFDFPAPIGPDVDGMQVTGWGSELNASRPMSKPAGLVEALIARHGPDPKMVGALKVDDPGSDTAEQSFSNPNIYRPEGLREYRRFLQLAIERRTDICLDLLARDEWDLFLALFVESHTANHLFWHAGRDYPLASPLAADEDPLLGLMQSIDAAIGRIAAALPPSTTLMVTTIDDTVSNVMDVPSMALLPELLYRWNFSGQAALAEGVKGAPLSPPGTHFTDHWKHEVWRLTTADGRQVLRSPAELEAAGDPLNWNPAAWYRPLWSQMRAFALPPVADGHIRLNVAGREGQGIVSPDAFGAVIDELTHLLEQLVDPRTGDRVVARVLRMREQPGDDPHIPPDLVVCWNGARPFDTIDSPTLGRVGPLPYFRSGGHRSHGTEIENLLVAQGPGIVAGTPVAAGRLQDVSATLLAFMDASPVSPIEGRPLFKPTCIPQR